MNSVLSLNRYCAIAVTCQLGPTVTRNHVCYSVCELCDQIDFISAKAATCQLSPTFTSNCVFYREQMDRLLARVAQTLAEPHSHRSWWVLPTKCICYQLGLSVTGQLGLAVKINCACYIEQMDQFLARAVTCQLGPTFTGNGVCYVEQTDLELSLFILAQVMVCATDSEWIRCQIGLLLFSLLLQP